MPAVVVLFILTRIKRKVLASLLGIEKKGALASDEKFRHEHNLRMYFALPAKQKK